MSWFMHTPAWHKIAASPEELPFAKNNIAVTIVGSKKICVGRYNGNLYAFSYTCPHASGLMSNGYIDALGNVVCPLHRYKFSMANGRNVSGEGYHLKNWKVEVREEGVFVEI
jgi:3-phenylpropionate/trans-cinnamate dioxygenase ferredoxin subunit